MSVTPVGKNKMMQRQEVRGAFTTDLSPLLKLALAPMPAQPPHKTQTQEIGADQAQSPQSVESADQQPPQGQPNQQGQQGQQGVGGSFQRPGAMQTQDPQQQQEEQIAQRKNEYRKILKLERALVEKLQAKKLKTKIKVKTTPKQLLITFDTSHKIMDEADGQAKPAEQALAQIIDWWKVDVGGDATYDVDTSGGSGRDIDKIDPSERVQFVFGYASQSDKKQQQDTVTTMNGGGQDVGMGGEEHTEEIGGGHADSRMGNVPQEKSPALARTLPEILALRKDALVKNLSRILEGAGVN